MLELFSISSSLFEIEEALTFMTYSISKSDMFSSFKKDKTTVHFM